MKKLLIAFFSFFLLSTFTGCIEIIEELTVAKNGSGNFKKIYDMSEVMGMMDNLKGIQNSDSAATEEQENMMAPLVKQWDAIRNMEGVSNVKIDTAKGVFTLNFDFKNTKALNEALATENKDKPTGDIYTFGKNTITRTGMNGLDKTFDEAGDESLATMKEMFKEMKYHLSITAPGSIKSYSNKNAKLSKNKKTVTLETSLLDLIEKKSTLEITISHKKK